MTTRTCAPHRYYTKSETRPFAMVSHSPHEFTLDFARLDYNTRPIQGVIVQRVNMSPLFVKQLIDALAANMADYARTMPDGMITEEDQ